jgi:hypothetical protein
MSTIKNFFRVHSEAVLISCATFFLAVIIGLLYGTLNVIFSQINRAIGPVSAQNGKGFDLQSAAQIDFRGLIDAGVPQAPQVPVVLPTLPPLPVSTPVTAATTTGNDILSPSSTVSSTTLMPPSPSPSGTGTTTVQAGQ